MLSCLPHLVISLGWHNNGGLHSSSFLLPLKKLLLGKKRPCVTIALDFSSKYNLIIVMQLAQKANQPLLGNAVP